MRDIQITKTGRGFAHIAFKDCYGAQCSLQKSSLADDDAVWLGPDKAEKHHVTGETIGTRMHLTRDDACRLISALEFFVETGELPDMIAETPKQEQTDG